MTAGGTARYKIERWRARAEEYRTTSESQVTASVREAYLTLARSCDRTADLLERPPQMGNLRLR
jgi:hypothetical protein